MISYVYTIPRRRKVVPVAIVTWPDGAVTCTARADAVFKATGHSGGATRSLEFATSLRTFDHDALITIPESNRYASES